MYLDQHITALSRACYFYLRSLRLIRRSLTDDMAISIAVALVQFRSDYCNSLLFGISAFNIHKLQRVQNLAARLALNNWSAPAHSLLLKLHWLPVQSRIKFKISSIAFKLMSENQPKNLISLIKPNAPPRLLRSSDQFLLLQPRVRTSTGQRDFSVCAPFIWNSIPLHIWLSHCLASVKWNLETFYFASS